MSDSETKTLSFEISLIATTLMIISLISFIYAAHYSFVYFLIPVAIASIAILISFRRRGRIYKLSIGCLVLLVCAIIFVLADDIWYRHKASLIAAIWNGNPKLVKRKINEGYDVNAKDGNGFTMLTLTFHTHQPRWKTGERASRQREEKIIEMLEILIENGAEVNALDEIDGRAPLHCIVSDHVILSLEYSIKIIKILISNGADVNLVSREGNTPLHILVNDLGNVQIAEILLKNGADINAKNSDGKTPLQLALENMNKYESYKDIVDFLRANGAK